MRRKLTVQCFSSQEPLHDGVATYSTRLNNAIISRDVRVLTPNRLFWLLYPFRKKFIPDFINNEESRFYKLLKFFYLKPIRKADICHFHLSGSIQSLFVLKNYHEVQGPKVITLHEKFMVKKPGLFDPEVSEKIIKESDAVIVHTDELKKYVSKIHDNVHLIPHAASAEMFQPYSQSEAKKVLGINRRLVLCIGFLSQNKGIELILTMAPRFDKEVQFIVAGESHYEPYYESLKKMDTLNILTPGYINDTKFRQLLMAADVVLLPRIFSQGECSGVMIEAMAAGKIIVASNIGCFSEYLAEGRGILVEPGNINGSEDAVTKALQPESQEIAHRAKAFAEQFLPFDKVAQEHIKVYESLLD